MSPEEFERIKAAEKAHLRKLRELKQAVHQLSRKQKISGTVADMAEGSRSLLDENQALVDRLALDAAHSEARLDVALDAEAERAAEAQREAAEAELRRQRADALVRQMKEELGGTPPRPEPSGVDASTPPPEKTIGQMPTRSSAAAGPEPRPEPMPEKTIGRMRPRK